MELSAQTMIQLTPLQFILLSPCLFLAQVYVLLPRLAETLDLESSLPIGRRTIKWVFISADVGTVLAQLAGTALTITFGDLVRIGKLVSTSVVCSRGL